MTNDVTEVWRKRLEAWELVEYEIPGTAIKFVRVYSRNFTAAVEPFTFPEWGMERDSIDDFNCCDVTEVLIEQKRTIGIYSFGQYLQEARDEIPI